MTFEPKGIDVLIFDWDGTIMDSTARICSAMRAAALSLGLSAPSDEAVRAIIGFSLEKAFYQLFGAIDETMEKSLYAAYRYQYVEGDQTPSPLFEHSHATLVALREAGYTLTIATGKGRAGIDRVIDESQTGHFFATTRSSDDAPSKPHPEMVLSIAAELDVEPGRCLVIGDTSHDMAMAELAQMPRIAATYGAHSKAQLSSHNPAHFIECISQLQTLLID